jgi:hypothetical protein
MQHLADRPRATRYEVSAALVYRRVGEEKWRRGRTENISRTGVLFQAAVPVLPAATRIEFILALPDIGPPGGSRVQCAGQIVRHCTTAADGDCAMAATIDAYDFLGVAPGGEL